VELFRDEWPLGVHPVQWNLMRSDAGVLRGVRVHPRHDDYLVLAAGKMTVGLHDLRPEAPSSRQSELVEITDDDPIGLVIPHGVAHGFFFAEPSVVLYGVSHYHDPSDELGCLWSDPELGLDWPVGDPIVSERDASLGSVRALLTVLGELQLS